MMTIDTAFETARKSRDERRQAKRDTQKAYTAVLLRLAKDKPKKSDADDLFGIATELGFTKFEIESHLEEVRRVLQYRRDIVDGKKSHAKVVEIREAEKKLREEFEVEEKRLFHEKLAHESKHHAAAMAPGKLQQIRSRLPHLFHESDSPSPTLLCEKSIAF